MPLNSILSADDSLPAWDTISNHEMRSSVNAWVSPHMIAAAGRKGDEVFIPLPNGLWAVWQQEANWPIPVVYFPGVNEGVIPCGYIYVVVRQMVENRVGATDKNLSRMLEQQYGSAVDESIELVRDRAGSMPEHLEWTDDDLAQEVMQSVLPGSGLPLSLAVAYWLIEKARNEQGSVFPRRASLLTSIGIVPNADAELSALSRCGDMLHTVDLSASWSPVNLLRKSEKYVKQHRDWWSLFDKAAFSTANLRRANNAGGDTEERRKDIYRMLNDELTPEEVHARELNRHVEAQTTPLTEAQVKAVKKATKLAIDRERKKI